MNQSIRKSRPTALLVDSNVLLLHVVGTVSPKRVETFKRTHNQRFCSEDVAILAQYLDQYSILLTTPHILTEVSNLLNGLPDKEQPFYRAAMGKLVRVHVLDERHTAATDLVAVESFKRWGLTDVGIIRMAGSGVQVLTDDMPLAALLYHAGAEVMNSNHLRGSARP